MPRGLDGNVAGGTTAVVCLGVIGPSRVSRRASREIVLFKWGVDINVAGDEEKHFNLLQAATGLQKFEQPVADGILRAKPHR